LVLILPIWLYTWYGEAGWECAEEKLEAIEIVSKNEEGSEHGSSEHNPLSSLYRSGA